MPGPVLESRLEFLRGAQNPDGGWGYLPGQPSWVEPTAYALVALHGQTGSAGRVERGWNVLRSWQRADGSWPPAPRVECAHWTTSLCVTLHCVRGVYDDAFANGLKWLLDARGAESSWWKRLFHLVQPKMFGHDPGIVGWPWIEGTGSWVEPTCHTLIALRKSASGMRVERSGLAGKLLERLTMGERMVLDRRAVDGGWNYGNRLVLGHELPSYPETTAVALLALMGAPGFDGSASLTRTTEGVNGNHSRLARAWLTICLRAYGQPVPDHLRAPQGVNGAVYTAALEAIGAPDGNFSLLKTECPQ